MLPGAALQNGSFMIIKCRYLSHTGNIYLMASFAGAYWNLTAEMLLEKLSSGREGLSQDEAGKRLREAGLNTLKNQLNANNFILFLRQFKSPITLILIFSSTLSFFLGERTDA